MDGLTVARLQLGNRPIERAIRLVDFFQSVFQYKERRPVDAFQVVLRTDRALNEGESVRQLPED